MSTLGTSYIQGLISGIDTASMVEQLAAIQRRPIERMELQRSELQDKLTLYGSINASLSVLRSSAQAISNVSSFMPRTASSSDATIMAVAAGAQAETGQYDVVVKALAKAHKIAGGPIADADAALGWEGEFLVNGETISVQADDTLTDLRDSINSAGAGVVATVLSVSSGDHRLMLSATTAGEDNAISLVDCSGSDILQQAGLLDGVATAKHAITNGFASDAFANPSQELGSALGLTLAPAGTISIDGQDVEIDLASDSLNDIRDRINSTVSGVTAEVVSEQVDGETVYRLQISGDGSAPALEDDDNVLQALGILTQGIEDERQAATDAEVTIDGMTVTRSSNSLDDVISGVSIELLAADADKHLTLSVTPSVESVVSSVQTFVNAYNSLASMLSEAQAFDQETGEGGLLFGDAAILRLEEGLHQSIMGSITRPGASSALISTLGLTSSATGGLSLNTAQLRSALQDDPDAVAKLFGLSGQGSTNAISFVSASSATSDTGAAGFAVNITQVATRATATSVALPGGIARDETLTFDGKWDINLTAGMSLSDAADHMNAWFETYGLSYSASAEDGTLKVTHDAYGANHSIEVSSSLDRGAGGTDLGGETAGLAASYVGKDVAGTINGEACIGRGQTLRGLQGSATTSGLEIRYDGTATGSVGTVTVAKGVARRLADYIERITDSDGMMSRGSEAVEADIEAVDEDIATVEERVQRYTDQMWSTFVTMESKLGQAKVLQEYMSGQIEALQKSYGSD